MSSITNKVTAGLVSIAFVFSAVATFSVTAQGDSTADLQAQVARLIAELNELKGLQKKSYTTVASGGNAACPYTWNKNLTIGSSGDDVRQLQRFLNGNPQTQVAVSGVGSPGSETNYYGPATSRAVSKFQEMYAAQILTPLGLTKGTGGFYTSTRNHANSLCQSGSYGSTRTPVQRADSRSATSAPVIQVTGDALAVTPGNPIGDAYVVQGAQRAPFTSIVLTAGNQDVRVEDIRVRRFGLSSSDNFDTVALVNVNGVQVGTARSLRRDEVNLGGSFVIPANRSITLAIVGNMANDDTNFSAGSIAGLEVAEVIANTRVQGNFPIRGAAHVLSSSITLQMAEIQVSGGGNDIEFDENTEVARVDIRLKGADADEEDAYLRSLILEQAGTADDEEVGDIEILVDNERADYSIAVDRDRYIINFDGRGVLIEEGDSVEVSLETSTNRGYEETVQFAIDDISDVYVVGASYGYGLPVKFSFEWDDTDGDKEVDADEEDSVVLHDKSEESKIQSGKVRDGGRLSKFEDEVKYGRDVILGALSVEFEGEDIDMEDLTFSAEIAGFPWSTSTDNAWENAEEDTVSFNNVRLRVDGETVAYADDGNIEFDEPSSDKKIPKTNIDFSDRFTIDVRENREVIFEIVADLDSAWSHFGGTDVEFILTSVSTAEGVRSEKDYTTTYSDSDKRSDEYFSSSREFKMVEIIGNDLAFEINDNGVHSSEFVAGKEDVIFGTLEVDASETVDDIELRNLYISFTIPNTQIGDLSDLENCRILDDSGKEVADSNSRLSGENIDTDKDQERTDQTRFKFDDFTVESGNTADLDIVCSIDTRAGTGDQYLVKVDATEKDRIEYNIGRDDYEKDLAADDESSTITVSAGGTLSVQTDNPNDDAVIAIAVGDNGKDNVDTLEITFEAEDEDMRITKMYLSGIRSGVTTNAKGDSITFDKDEIREMVDRVSIEFDNEAHARYGDFEADVTETKEINGDCEDVPSSGTDNCLETDDVTIPTLTNALEFDVNEVISVDDEEKTINLSIDYQEIDDNINRTRSGHWLKATNLVVVYEGEDSGTVGVVNEGIETHFTKNVLFPTLATISTRDYNQTLGAGSNKKLYEFTVRATDEGDVYLKKIAVSVDISGTVSLTEGVIKEGGRKISNVIASVSESTSGNPTVFTFTEAERIKKGTSKTFAVEMKVTSVNDASEVVIELIPDDTTERTVAGRKVSEVVGNFVWSPNTFNRDDDEGSDNTKPNPDWFNGWAIFDSNDISSWTSDK